MNARMKNHVQNHTTARTPTRRAVEVYRPVNAVMLAEDVAVLVRPPEYDSTDERWEYQPGSVVRVATRVLQGGEATVAVAEVPDFFPPPA